MMILPAAAVLLAVCIAVDGQGLLPLPPVGCSLLLCALRECKPGETLVTPEGECCPTCVPTPIICALVRCAHPGYCPAGLTVPEGECCPKCVSACDAVICLNSFCPAGQKAKVPAGECCPRCTGSCDTKVCPLGSSCEINEPTGEAFCVPSCSIDNGGCPRDQSCSLQVVSCIRAPCPPVVQCTDICALPVEPGPCRGSLPRFFHNSATGQCEAFTYGGCGGNSNNFMSLEDCQENCQASLCDTVRCRTGFRCEVFNNEVAFCQPDCKLDNGGCPAGEICRLEDVVCKRAPCPPNRICDCPPACSKEFCADKQNRNKPCSNQGYNEIPGCTGRCHFSYCKACYVGTDTVSSDTCTADSAPCNYSSPSTCYFDWARCKRRAHKKEFGKESIQFTSEGEIHCYNPTCMRKG